MILHSRSPIKTWLLTLGSVDAKSRPRIRSRVPPRIEPELSLKSSTLEFVEILSTVGAAEVKYRSRQVTIELKLNILMVHVISSSYLQIMYYM
jgi:hypothetical protein